MSAEKVPKGYRLMMKAQGDVGVCKMCDAKLSIGNVHKKMEAIDLDKVEVSQEEQERFSELRPRIQHGIMEFLEDLVKKNGCCDLKTSMNMEFRNNIGKTYHALKKDLIENGMDPEDSILLRLRKMHLQFAYKMLSADLISLEMDYGHIFGVGQEDETDGPSSSGVH